MSELNLMQGIDSHQNVVELLGCVTETGTNYNNIVFGPPINGICGNNCGVNYKA